MSGDIQELTLIIINLLHILKNVKIIFLRYGCTRNLISIVSIVDEMLATKRLILRIYCL